MRPPTAKQAVSALRYYDHLGLLGDIPRQAGVRRFPISVVRRLALIRAAQEAGFTLAEIKLLLDQQPHANIRQQWEALAARRLPEIDAMINRLTRLRDTVADCLACGCLSLTTCAMLRPPPGHCTWPAMCDQGDQYLIAGPGTSSIRFVCR